MSFKKEKVRALMIFDVIGKPPKHLVETLKVLIKEIEKEKGVSVKMKDVKKPTLMKDQEDFYTTFAEVEVEVEEILYLVVLMFKYMPAHIEIIEPETIPLETASWNEILNELVRRLHAYDEIARVVQIENAKLNEQLKQHTQLHGQEQEARVVKQNNKKIKRKRKK